MKSIVAVNTDLPSIEHNIEYLSGESLRDYDIALIDIRFPYMDRVHFSGGGSCISIEGSEELLRAMRHWSDEILGALKAGKTIFVILTEKKSDLASSNYSTTAKNRRQYSTFSINNYQALPIELNVQNSKGKQIVASEAPYRGLLGCLKGLVKYEVILEEYSGLPIFTTRDKAVVGGVGLAGEYPGHLVLLPFFSVGDLDQNPDGAWSEEALRVSSAVVTQLVAIDKSFTQGTIETPPPDWLNEMERPQEVASLEIEIGAIEQSILELNEQKGGLRVAQARLHSFSRLLYENGAGLEAAIEDSLRVFGFAVETFRDGDLEIDHVIVGPSGIRMVGESEGKDNSAVDIAKFRQLESNINEDFERESVAEHAKGVLFGNGFRLTRPSDRAAQFTDKCLKNSARLGTALVRTSDLHRAVVYALDNPDDEAFLGACRAAIENTSGGIVEFPVPNKAF